MNKCIWYITKYLALPSDESPGGRSFLVMKALAGLGNQCVLIGSDSNTLCAMPKFTGSSYNAKFDGMQVVLLKTFKYGVAKSLRRVLSWLHFEWRLLTYSKSELPQPDVVIISSLSLLTILNGFILKFRYKCKLVFEIRDIWPLTLTEDGEYSKYNFLVYFLSLIEKYGYRYADIIVGTMPNLGEHVENILGFPKPVYCIPMGVPEDALRNIIPLSVEYRQKYIPNDKFIVGYAGTLGITNALDILFQCAEKMQDNTQVCFLVVGNGDLRDGYMSRYRYLPNVIFAPAVEKYAVQSVLAECDLLYFSAFKSKIFDYGQSLNKLIDYMLSAKPILASYSGYPSMINEAGCGTFVPADDSVFLEQEIIRYSKLSPQARSAIGARGRDWLLENRQYYMLAEEYQSIIFSSQ
jgi:glycosyltransferase involved in cell wall biosynthesis